MRVFLSWSGDRSRMIAEALRTWLSDVVQYLDPWMSSEDIGKGARWSLDLLRELEATKVGIVCLTPENLTAPWILFEAGALGKALDKNRVCTYLYELRSADIQGPLLQFQATVANEKDTRKLVHTLNACLDQSEVRSNEQIDRAFIKWWPELKKALDRIPSTEIDTRPKRSDREMIEEVLDLTRILTIGSQGSREPHLGRDLGTTAFFEGQDVRDFVSDARLEGSGQDPNAQDWAGGEGNSYDSLDGTWKSRWTGGPAGGRWRIGTAKLVECGRYVVVLYTDDAPPTAVWLGIGRHEGTNLIVGRYINLQFSGDSTPWVARTVANNRIDGQWSLGRWDFRR